MASQAKGGVSEDATRKHFLFDWYGPRERVQVGADVYDSPFSVHSGNTTVLYGTASYDSLEVLMDGSGYHPMGSDEAGQRAFVELWVNQYRSTTVGPYLALLLFAVGQRSGNASGLPDPAAQPFSSVLPFFIPGDKALVNLGVVVNTLPAQAYGGQVLGVAKELRRIDAYPEGNQHHTVVYDAAKSTPHILCRLRNEVKPDDRWDALKQLSHLVGFEPVVQGLVQAHQGLPVPRGKLAFCHQRRWRVDESRFHFNPAYWLIDPRYDSISVPSQDTEFGKRLAGLDFVAHVGARDPDLKVVIFPEGMTPDP